MQTHPRKVRAIAAKRTAPKRKRKPAGRKRAPAKKRAAPKIVPLPKAGPGERVFLLDVPYEMRQTAAWAGAKWNPTTKQHVFVGKELPEGLVPFAPEAYSWAAWQDANVNKNFPSEPPAPDRSTGEFVLRDAQESDVSHIVAAHAAGAPEFMLANDVGTGKTAIAVAAVKRLPGVLNVLVVCPFSVKAVWRAHLQSMGDGGMRWCIQNYESSLKLLDPPTSALAAKKQATKNRNTAKSGTSLVNWDVVITDESHYLADPDSLRSRAMERLIGNPGGPAFSLRMSATAGANPAKLSYLHRGFAYASGAPVKQSVTGEEYQAWAKTHGITVTPGQFGTGLAWNGKDSDLDTIHRLIFRTDPKWGVRTKANFPEQQRIPHPVALTPDQMVAYEVAWSEFQMALAQIETKRSVTGAKEAKIAWLKAMTRYRQKAGLLRAPGTADLIVEMLANGKQVAVACEYTGTVKTLVEHLGKKRITPALFTGNNRDTRESERVAYQRGDRKVILFTPAEGFSLHAGDTLAGGNDTPRVTIVAEPRWSPTKSLQIEGRGQRNGTEAPVWYPYAERTIEEKVIRKAIEGMRSTAIINGDSPEYLSEVAELLGGRPDYLDTPLD